MGGAVALPEGFQLDAPQGLPAGFQLDDGPDTSTYKDTPSVLQKDSVAGEVLHGLGKFLLPNNYTGVSPIGIQGSEKSDLTHFDNSRGVQGAVGGLIQLGAGINEVVGKATGNTKQVDDAAKAIRSVQRDVDNLGDGAQGGATVGRNALLAAAPGSALGSAAVAGANALATPDPTGKKDLIDRGVEAVEQGGMAAVGTKAFQVANEGISLDGLKNITKGFGAKSADEWKAVGADMQQRALDNLSAANRSGTVVSADAAKIGLSNVVKQTAAGQNLEGAAADKLYSNTKAFLSDLSSYGKDDLTLEQIHQLRQTGSALISKSYRTGENADAHALIKAVDHFDDWVDNIHPNDLAAGSTDNIQHFNDFKSQYADFKRFDNVQKLVEYAGGDMNKVRNQIKLWFKPGNEKKLAGYTGTQKELLRAVAYPGKGQQLLNLIGTGGIDVANPQNSWLGPFLSTMAGLTHGVASGGATLAGATAARYAGQKLGQGAVEDVLGSLAKGKAATTEAAPVARALSNQRGSASPSSVLTVGVGAAGVGGLAGQIEGGRQADAQPAQPPVQQTVAQPTQAPEQTDEIGNLIQNSSLFDPQSYKQNVIKAEGQGRNPKSSAKGIGQFTNGTWIAEVKRQDPQAAEGKNAAQILKLRDNPTYAAKILDGFTQTNAQKLSDASLPVTNGSVYLAHFLGLDGAKIALNADPRKLVSAVNPAAAKSNSFLKGVRLGDLFKAAEIAATTGRPMAQALKDIRS